MKPIADKAALFRMLPSVDELLKAPELREHVQRGQKLATAAAREAIENLRTQIASGSAEQHEIEVLVRELPLEAVRLIERSTRPTLRRVVNATGVILHTNLGRAPLSEAAVDHLRAVSTRYSNLEFDIDRGDRGKRDVHADAFFRALFRDAAGARELSTIVVNNNAAAVLLALNALAEGGEVIVSRGELVEIGGSFRIPDVMSKSGAVLREVGTTNRTRIGDYERAISDRTRLLLRVHRSNFEIVGFTQQPTLEELVALGRKHNIPVMEDLGSGALFDLRAIGVQDEPTVYESLRAGVDLVTYSGDKLLGGPQAGILTGRLDLVSTIRSNPLFRALRVDKLTYAVLQHTLASYLREDWDAIPAVRMMRISHEQLRARAQAVSERLRNADKDGDPHESTRNEKRAKRNIAVELADGESVLGGGAAPGASLPTTLLRITHPVLSADELSAALRRNDPSIITRVVEDRVVIDLRSVFPDEEEYLIEALARI